MTAEKTDRKVNSTFRPVFSFVSVARVAVPKQIERRIRMIEVKVLSAVLRGRWCREALAPEKGRDPRSGKDLPAPSATEQS